MRLEDMHEGQKVQFCLSPKNWEPLLRPHEGAIGTIKEVRSRLQYERDLSAKGRSHAARIIWDNPYEPENWWYIAEDLQPLATGEF